MLDTDLDAVTDVDEAIRSDGFFGDVEEAEVIVTVAVRVERDLLF